MKKVVFHSENGVLIIEEFGTDAGNSCKRRADASDIAKHPAAYAALFPLSPIVEAAPDAPTEPAPERKSLFKRSNVKSAAKITTKKGK